jgi:dolichol-phosphate mannosyltransferase
MRYAIEKDYDLMVNMDADFSHHPRYLPALVAGMDRHDIMIGSRYVPGGGTVDWPASRLLISRSINCLVRFLFRFQARDCSGGYRCYRVAKLREARLDQLISRGYSFQQEVLYRCRKAGCRIGETPIIFADRRAGSSKVNPREAARSLATLVWLGLHCFFGLD